MKNFKNIALIAFVWLFNSSLSFSQCAMCRATVESSVSNGRGSVGSGLNAGILYMLSAPYVLVAIMGFVWYQNSKKETIKRLELKKRLRKVFGV